MSSRTCFFIGNRNTPGDIKARLLEVVEQHITEYGVDTFIVGHYGRFDCIVQNVLRETKTRHENIKLYLLAPYALTQKIEIPEDFNGSLYPEGMEKVPKLYAIAQANRYMIQHSNYLIAYCHHIGNTRNFVEYAQKREKSGLIKLTLL